MHQVIVMRSDLKMGKGKIAAQAGHAVVSSMLKTEKVAPQVVKQWLEQGQKKVVLKVGSEKELITLFSQVSKTIPCSLIRDAGHTQVDPGTITCFGTGPWYSDDLNLLMDHLKLL